MPKNNKIRTKWNRTACLSDEDYGWIMARFGSLRQFVLAALRVFREMEKPPDVHR